MAPDELDTPVQYVIGLGGESKPGGGAGSQCHQRTQLLRCPLEVRLPLADGDRNVGMLWTLLIVEHRSQEPQCVDPLVTGEKARRLLEVGQREIRECRVSQSAASAQQ